MLESKKEDPSRILLRHQLGSIDLSDIENKEMTEAERKEYCAAISGIFPRLEKDIKKVMYEQVLKTADAPDWEKVNYGRGTMNGISLLYELWKEAYMEHLGRIPQGDFDRSSPIGEIGE